MTDLYYFSQNISLMRKVFALSLLAIIVFSTIDAAAGGRKRKYRGRRGGDRIEQGTSFIDANYGFPNLFTTMLRTTFETPGTDDFNVTSFGPAEMRYEYMVNDKIGIGAMANYSNSGMSFTDSFSDFDSGEMNTYNYDIDITRLRFLPKLTFHFGNGRNFDAYTSAAVGYINWSFSVDTNDPEYGEDEVIEDLGNVSGVGYRATVGMRYMFGSSIGANLEFGLGSGALINGGVSIRF